MASGQFILPQDRVEATLGISFEDPVVTPAQGNPGDPNYVPEVTTYDPALELLRGAAIEYGEAFLNASILDRTAAPMKACFGSSSTYFELQDSIENVNLSRLPFEQVNNPIDDNAQYVTRGWFSGVEEFVYPGSAGTEIRVAAASNLEIEVLGYDTDSVPLYAFKTTGNTSIPNTHGILFVNTGISEVSYNRYMTERFKNGLLLCCEAIKQNHIRGTTRHATPKDLEYAAMLFGNSQPITRS